MMGAPLSELSPYASARHFFGAEVRLRRLAAGLSQDHLAEQVITATSTVNKVELARRFPSADFATRCDAVLNAGGALIRLHQLAMAERARDARQPEMPVVLSGPEARALRRLLDADTTDVSAEAR
jgi:transcriptional regulator with XRE-family HTH domain